MNIAELQELLVAERDWRTCKLEFCKKIPFLYAKSAFQRHLNSYWRICVPIVYAHREGFVVAVKQTIDYINSLNLAYSSAPRYLIRLENKKDSVICKETVH